MDRREYRTYIKGIEGSAARKLAVAPKPDRRVVEQPKRKISRQTRNNRQKALRMNGKYVFFLAIAAVFCLGVCVKYIDIQSQVSAKTNHINQMKNEIKVLTTQNDSLDYSINSFIDIDNICKIAKKELGMIEATGTQVSLYDKSSSEYMNQIDDIPSE